MNVVPGMRGTLPVGTVAAVAALLAISFAVPSRAQTADKASIAGAWTLNKELSDQPTNRTDGTDSGARPGGANGGSGRGGGYGRGGGGGFGRRGRTNGGGTAPVANPEDMARLRDAMRDLTDASDHLTITQTESMVVVTGADGRTTRLSPDGKKVKDDNTKIERKTRWDGAKLVTEISGLGSSKATQTFAVDAESHQLRLTVQMEGGRSGSTATRTITHVYDADTR